MKSHVTVSREAELLVCCARKELDAAHGERIRTLVRQDLDWPLVRAAARAHATLPLLYWHLGTIGPAGVPPAVLAELRADFHANTRRNLRLTGELLAILDLFRGQGIAAIPFKGPALAAAAYGNLALRQFVDLDLLVHPQDVRRAKALLATRGYGAALRLTEDQEAALLRDRYEHLLRREDDGTVVEIQWRIVPRHFGFPLDYARL